jgi:hypothetical protein
MKPVILIVGMARVGKTRLARMVADKTGFRSIHGDVLMQEFWTIPDLDERAAARLKTYTETLAAEQSGSILEGVDLIHRNFGDPERVRRGAIRWDLTASLTLVRALSARFAARTFIVGCSDADGKHRAIRKHRTAECWTYALSDVELANVCAEIARGSEDLRRLAAQDGLDYFDLPADVRDEELERIAKHIVEAVGLSPTAGV